MGYTVPSCANYKLNSNFSSVKGYSLPGVLPPQLVKLPYLKEVNLESNQFTSFVPPELGNLINLQTLIISSISALRSVEQHLNLEKLYVLGTNCVDNGTREGLDKFLKAASDTPETVLHYEFMQDYKVHLKHLDGHIEEFLISSTPQMSLRVDVIAPHATGKICFDYTNALADLVVGYMSVPKYSGVSMTQHPQYVTVRNERGREMLSLIGPKGLEFGRYSLDYHTICNYLYVNRAWGKERADRHMPFEL
ncbi:hypothetical protein K1719_009981 [Acacia pycnantha]|nr:hypothetical protein K1719_009981 [Acacia pycnantha]